MAKRRRKRHLALKIVIFVILALILAVIAALFFSGVGPRILSMKRQADQLVAESDESTFVPSQTGTIYDRDGDVISELVSDKNATYLKSGKIPDTFKKAIVSIEDKKFYRHHGVDYEALIRAFKELIQNRAITQGGSTITMQLAKNVFLTNSRTWERKVEEIFIAKDLEKKYTKDQILEFYLNNIYFANGYYGISAASKGYFNSDPDELDLSQTAFLCAIPNSPTYYDPIEHKDHTLKRRDLILENMLSDGIISQSDYDDAVAEEITLDLSASQKKTDTNFVDTYVYHCATEALMENDGFDFEYDFDSDQEKEKYEDEYDQLYEECQAKLFSGGYQIYTSFDMDKQAELQDAVNETLEDFTDTDDDGIYELQGAAVCIDNETGYVVAMVGGREQEELTGHTLNRAFQSLRQPGSTIKPILVYTPAFDEGYTPDSVVNDHNMKSEDGPENSGGRYYGRVTIREAVQRSLNTVAWQLYEDITPKVGLQYLKNMNFSGIVEDDETLATSIGGFTNGVKAVEMAAGFATLENDGNYREPTCIISMEDYTGDTVYQSEQDEKEIYQENSARMMTDVLQGVLDERRGTGYGLALDNDMPAAAKTGTTNDNRDGWFVGYTRYYTTSVWVGCDTQKSVRGLQGASYPGEIWNTYMNEIHEGLEPLEFEEYEDVKATKKNLASSGSSSRSKSGKKKRSTSVTPTPTEEAEEEEEEKKEENTTENTEENNENGNENQGENNSGNTGQNENHSQPEPTAAPSPDNQGENDSGDAGHSQENTETGENGTE